MFTISSITADSKADIYAELLNQAQSLLSAEHDRIANAANLSALVFHALPDINWVGFYFFDGRELVLGPFQGKPACIRIALNRGVCGAAASQRLTQLVLDVLEFPGHIACDAASRSEIVVPLVHHDVLIEGCGMLIAHYLAVSMRMIVGVWKHCARYFWRVLSHDLRDGDSPNHWPAPNAFYDSFYSGHYGLAATCLSSTM
jgi:L-methionine (R)-S-oxide reductase